VENTFTTPKSDITSIQELYQSFFKVYIALDLLTISIFHNLLKWTSCIVIYKTSYNFNIIFYSNLQSLVTLIFYHYLCSDELHFERIYNILG